MATLKNVVIGIILAIAFLLGLSMLSWRRRFLHLAGVRDDHATAAAALRRLEPDHRELQRLFDAKERELAQAKADLDVALATNRTLMSDCDTARREFREAIQERDQLRNQELPKARAAVPPEVVGMHKRAETALVSVAEHLAGRLYETGMGTDMTLEERIVKVRDLAHARMGITRDAVFRLADALQIETPSASTDLHDSIVRASDAARHLRQTFAANQTLLSELAGRPPLEDGTVDIVPYLDLKAERDRLAAHVAQLEASILSAVEGGSVPPPDGSEQGPPLPAPETAVMQEEAPANPAYDGYGATPGDPGTPDVGPDLIAALTDDGASEDRVTVPGTPAYRSGNSDGRGLGQTMLIADYEAEAVQGEQRSVMPSGTAVEVHAVPAALGSEAVDIQGPSTMRYPSEPPSRRREGLGRATTQGMQAVTTETLDEDARSRFFGAIDWLVGTYSIDQPFIVKGNLELSTLLLLMKMPIYVGNQLMHVGELVERKRYERLQSGEWVIEQQKDVDLVLPGSREELFNAFYVAMRRINQSHPYHVTRQSELGQLHELCQVGIVHEGGEMKLGELLDSSKTEEEAS
jgi:hypothetical protein